MVAEEGLIKDFDFVHLNAILEMTETFGISDV